MKTTPPRGASVHLAVAAAALAFALAPPPAWAQASATEGKKELVQKVMTLQQPAIEALARQLVEEPAARLMQQAAQVLQQRVAAERREAVGKEIQADLQKYAAEAMPIVRERALKLAPSTVGSLIEERFSEDELRQLIAILESPVNRKYQGLGVEMQRALGQKLVAESRSAVEPKLQALEKTVAQRLGITPPSAPKPSAPAGK